MKTRQSLRFLLSLCLVFAMLLVPAAAVGEEEGTLDGSGTYEEPFLISTVDDLKFFRDQVNAGESYAGKYFLQTAHIDLAGENWTPIGTIDNERGFCGNYDGQNFEIQNLTITNPAKDADGYVYAGLFGITEENTIQNVTIRNVTISTDGHIVAAAIAYPYYTVADNIKVCGDISITGGNYTAGVLGYTRRCYDATGLTIAGETGSAITGGITVGGIIADIQTQDGQPVNYADFNASGLTITGTKAVGGITGIISKQTLNGCSVKDVTLVCDNARVGIVSGTVDSNPTILNVTVENVTGADSIVGTNYGDGAPAPASVNGTYYATLQAAIAAAEAGETVTIANDITLTDTLLISADKVITIDLNGKTVSQEKACDGSYSMILNKGTLTINDSVGGGKISFTDTVAGGGSTYGTYTITNQNASLTINGGTIEHLTDAIGEGGVGYKATCYPIQSYCGEGDASLTINGGTISAPYSRSVRIWASSETYTHTVVIQDGVFEGQVWLQNPSGGSKSVKADVTIKGGDFAPRGADGSSVFIDDFANANANITVAIEGGNFNTKIGGKTGASYSVTGGTFAVDPSAFMADGYAVFETANGYEVKVLDETTAIAKVGEELFASLQAAVDAAAEAGETVVVLNDVQLANTLVIAKDTSVVLNLNGKVISGVDSVAGTSAVITNKGTLEIMDSVGGGKVTTKALYPDTDWGEEGFPSYANNTIRNEGTFTLTSGIIENTTPAGGATYCIDNYGGSSCTINGGKVINENTLAIRLFCGDNISLTVNGGEIIGTRAIWVQLASSNPAVAPNVDVTITGGTITRTKATDLALYSYNYGNSPANVNISVSGGTFNGDIGLTGGTTKTVAETLTITGGTFTDVYSYAEDAVAAETVTISGGTFTGTTEETGTVLYAEAYIAEGYVAVKTANGYEVKVLDETTAIAKVGEELYGSLQAALDAAAKGTGDVTVEILKDIDLTNVDWTPVTVSAPGYPKVIVNGNEKTITGLNDMLFAGTWAGKSGLIINDLTIKDSTIVNDENDAMGNVGVGAFIGYPQASATITLNNCHLVDSTVKGGHWTGGLIGMAGGYNGTDGPVFMDLTITDCSVTGSTITGKGSAGAVIGHASCAAWTKVVIEDTIVTDNTISSTGSSDNKAGVVMGTIGAAGQEATSNGIAKTGGVYVSVTESGNTVTSAETTITTVYGRQGSSTGVLTITGGIYENYPIEPDVAYANIADGYAVFETANGYEVKVLDETTAIAKVGEELFASITEAINAAGADEAVVLLRDITVDADSTIVIASGKTVTIDLNDHTLAGESDQTGSNRNLFDVRGTLTVTNGTVTVQHVGENLGWSNSTNVFNVTAGGVLNIVDANIENLGGSDMAFVAHLNNWGEVTLNVDNSTLKSTYIPVRVFNSGNDMNNVTIQNSTLESTAGNRALWVHNFTAADFGTSYDAAKVEARLNFDIFGNGNSFPVYNAAANRVIELGFTNPVNMDTDGNYVARNAYALGYALSKGGKVTLGADIELTETLVIPAGADIAIDLNGKVISGVDSVAGTSAVITNKGTLEIMDSVGGGKVTTKALYPDTDWGEEGFPSYANNTIRNEGDFTLTSGIIENTTPAGGATYCIDNYAGSSCTINGGKVINENTLAIRLFCGNDISLTVNGGEITGTRGIWVQLAGSDANTAPTANVTITGGTITNTKAGDLALYVYSFGNSAANVTVNVTGGIFNGDIGLYELNTMKAGSVSITGGTFLGESGVLTYGSKHDIFVISGGTFAAEPNAAYLAENYVAIETENGYEVKNLDETTAAKIGDQEYKTLTEAIAAVKDDKTILLVRDCTKEEPVVVNKVICFFIDNNGFGFNFPVAGEGYLLSASGSPMPGQEHLGVFNFYLDMAAPTISVTIDSESNTPVISWDRVDRAEQYALYIYEVTENGLTAVDTIVTPGAGYHHTDAIPGATYRYKVCGVIGEEEGKFSPLSTDLYVPKFLPAPDAVEAGLRNDGIVEVTWNTVEGADSYGLFIYRVDGSELVADGEIYTSDNFFIHSNAAEGVTYVYRVASFLKTFGGDLSEPAEITVPVKQPPVLFVEPSDIEEWEGKTVHFLAQAKGEGLTYQWQYKVAGSSTWRNSTNGNSEQLDVVVEKHRDGYQYRCIVSNAYGEVISNAATLTITPAVKLAASPEDASVITGETAYFLADAVGSGLTYQWQYKTPSGDWANSTTSTSNSATLSVIAYTYRNGYQYRCIITDGNNNSVISEAATLTVRELLAITGQSTSTSVNAGDTVALSVTATGEGLTYQWQIAYPDQDAWIDADFAGADTAVMTLQANMNVNGAAFRCIVTDGSGETVTSDDIILTVQSTLKITSQPVSQLLVNSGTQLAFTVEAEGEGLTYQWQFRFSTAENWRTTTVAGNQTNTITPVANASRDGAMYRCRIRDAYGAVVYSDVVMLTLRTPLEIVADPTDEHVLVNDVATFYVSALGDGLTYRWQYRTAPTGSWHDSTNSTAGTDALSVTALDYRNGYEYRCIVTDSSGAQLTSGSAALILIGELTVTQQPENVTAPEGTGASFSAAANGDNLIYQWQYLLKGEWFDIADATDSVFVIESVTEDMTVRCVITDAYSQTVVTDSAELTVLPTLEITGEPEDALLFRGETAYFTVDAKGTGLTYQWQYKVAGGSAWSNSTGSSAKSATMSVVAYSYRDGYEYRCIVTDAYGNSEISASAALYLLPDLMIVADPADADVAKNATAEFSVWAHGEGLTYQWQYKVAGGSAWNNSSGSAAKTDTYSVVGYTYRDGYQYRCVVTDQNGDQVISSAATLTVN